MLKKDFITQATTKYEQLKKKFKNQFPNSEIETEFIIERADSYLRLKKYTKSLDEYNKLLTEYEDNRFMSRILYGQSKIYLNIGKKEQSQDLLKQIILEYPSSTETILAKYYLTDYYLAQEKYDIALRYLEPILIADNYQKQQKRAYKKIIDLYLKLGLDNAALNTINTYIVKYPNEPDIFQKKIKIGNIYQRQNKYQQAFSYFNTLLLEAKGDDEAAIQFFIAETYFQKKEYRRAISEFLKVKYLIKTKSPYDWGITSVYKASQAYEFLKEYDKAIALLEQIAKKYQENTKYGRYARKEMTRLKSIISNTNDAQ